MALTYQAGRRIQGTAADRAGGGLTGIGGWVELGRTTASGSEYSVSSLTDKRYYMILTHAIPSGNCETGYRLNGDSGSNYASRHSKNGSEGTTTSATDWHLYAEASPTEPNFTVSYLSNLSSKEKLHLGHTVFSTTGSGNAPGRREFGQKWANTSNPVSSLTVRDRGHTGSFASGETIVLGWDPDDTHTTNFWEEIGSATGTSIEDITLDSDKKYLWIQAWVKSTGGTLGTMLRVGDTSIDSGTNYAQRRQSDGGSEFTDTSTTGLNVEPATSASGLANFINCFVINNASNEKLFISHGIYGNTAGAGNAPNRRELAGKWANTSNQIGHVGIVDTSGTGSIDSTSVVKVWGAD